MGSPWWAYDRGKVYRRGGGVGTRMSISINFDGGDGSVLWVYRGVRMMGEKSEGAWQGGIGSKSKEV